jgi:hypothetical protein
MTRPWRRKRRGPAGTRSLLPDPHQLRPHLRVVGESMTGQRDGPSRARVPPPQRAIRARGRLVLAWPASQPAELRSPYGSLRAHAVVRVFRAASVAVPPRAMHQLDRPRGSPEPGPRDVAARGAELPFRASAEGSSRHVSNAGEREIEQGVDGGAGHASVVGVRTRSRAGPGAALNSSRPGIAPTAPMGAPKIAARHPPWQVGLDWPTAQTNASNVAPA